MKKTAVYLSILVLSIFASAGCNDTYQASTSNNNNTVVQEAYCPDGANCINYPNGTVLMHFNNPIQLGELLEKLHPNQKIFQLTTVNANGITHTVALTQPYSDVNALLIEYKTALDGSLKPLMQNLKDWQDRTPEVNTQSDIDEIQETLNNEPDATLLVTEALVKEE